MNEEVLPDPLRLQLYLGDWRAVHDVLIQRAATLTTLRDVMYTPPYPGMVGGVDHLAPKRTDVTCQIAFVEEAVRKIAKIIYTDRCTACGHELPR